MSSPQGSAFLGHVAAAGAAAAAVADSPRIVRSELSVSNKRGISRGRKARVSRDPSEEFFHHRSALTFSTRVSGSHAYDAEDPRVVFVGGVPYDLSANAVSDDFESTFGSVMDVRLVPHRKGKDGEHKGYGFVTFAVESTALSARDAGKITLGGGVVVQIGRAEKGVGRFSDDRSSTTTATSVESGLSEAASFHSYLLARNGGYPTSPESASGSESGSRARVSARGTASGPGSARGGRGGRRGAGGSQSSSRDGGSSRDGSDAAFDRRANKHASGVAGGGGGRRHGGRRQSGGPRGNRPPLPNPRANANEGSTAFRDAYWMFRERLEYGYAFATALRDFYESHGLTPPAAQIGGGATIPGPPEGPEGPGPDDVLISGGVFPAVVEAAAPPFASAPSASAAASRSDVGAREAFVGGLPMDTRDHDLVWFFSHWGAVEGARVMHDVHTGVSRQFGFVRFAETRAANAVKALNVVHFTDGTPVEVGDVSRAPLKSSVSGAGRGAGTARSSDLSDVTAALASAKLGPAQKLGPDPPPGAEDVAKTTLRVRRGEALAPVDVVSLAKISEASSGAGTPGGAGSSGASTPDTAFGATAGGSPASPGGAKTELSASPPTVLRRRAA